MVLVVVALQHVFFVDEYVSSLWKQILWGLMSAAFVGLAFRDELERLTEGLTLNMVHVLERPPEDWAPVRPAT